MSAFNPIRLSVFIAQQTETGEQLDTDSCFFSKEEFHTLPALKGQLDELEGVIEGRRHLLRVEDLTTSEVVDLTLDGIRQFIEHHENDTLFRVYAAFDDEVDTQLVLETKVFAEVVEKYRVDPQTYIVYKVVDDKNVPYSMEDHFAEEDLTLELPAQPKMSFTVAKPTTRLPSNDDSTDDPIPILREMSKNVESMIDLFRDHFRQLGRREEALFDARKKSGLDTTGDDGNFWYRNLLAAIQNTASSTVDMEGSYKDGAFGERTFAQPHRDWKQILQHEDVALRPGAPRQKVTGDNSSANDLVSYIGRRMKKTSPFEVPLYGSGFWIRLRAPSLDDFTELQYHISELRVSVGSRTKGMAFSNMMQTMKSVVMDFALQYVTAASVQYTTASDLKDKIVITDIDSIIWGLATTIYPRGFPYSHSCVADPKTCNHVERTILDLRWLLWTDELSLTQKQRRLMARKWSKTTTDEELAEYREEHRRGAPRTLWVGDFGLQLKVPTLFEYEQSGKAWIDGLIESTKLLFNEPPHAAARNKHISVRAEATSACEYSHFVGGIYERDPDDDSDEPVLLSNNQEVIESLLGQIFSESDVLEDVVKGITKFIDDSIISLVAVESYDCPKCKTPISEKFYERFPHLVALDVFTVFFILVNRKLSE